MKEYIKECQECNNALKTKGIGIINTISGQVEYQDSFSIETEQLLQHSMEKGKLNGINAEFNSIFYKRSLPSLIRIKHKAYSEFIKFLDKDRIMYFVQDNSSINYPKIKLYFSKIF